MNLQKFKIFANTTFFYASIKACMMLQGDTCLGCEGYWRKLLDIGATVVAPNNSFLMVFIEAKVLSVFCS